ncbi:uncharacterized protein TNIN_416561 [Trichonephila inaurata madagascariensis]|uniref:Uncharacterized protein n=1 Tax=Trichonephila inaurata madagascariensis TaxID=2747483 RepID=A0A8X6YUU3_9ARAC|nr:uncharacterized protein TNIN_416561 [Trichonephila inaurata madagascariensis]
MDMLSIDALDIDKYFEDIIVLIWICMEPSKVTFNLCQIVLNLDVPVYTHSAEAYQVDGGQQYSHYSHDTLDDIAQLQQLSGSHALAQLESAADNIDSWVQQLSISSGGLKGSYSDDIPTIHDDFDEFSHGLADIHGIEDWW